MWAVGVGVGRGRRARGGGFRVYFGVPLLFFFAFLFVFSVVLVLVLMLVMLLLLLLFVSWCAARCTIPFYVFSLLLCVPRTRRFPSSRFFLLITPHSLIHTRSSRRARFLSLYLLSFPSSAHRQT